MGAGSRRRRGNSLQNQGAYHSSHGELREHADIHVLRHLGSQYKLSMSQVHTLTLTSNVSDPPQTSLSSGYANMTQHPLNSAFGVQTIVSLLKLRPTLIRGNASEIMAVAGAAGATTRGLDSTAATSDALASGKKLAQEYGCIVGISGADDLVSIVANACCDLNLCN